MKRWTEATNDSYGWCSEDVPGAHRGEDVRFLVGVGRQQTRRHDRLPWRVVERRDVEIGDRVERVEIEHPGDLVYVRLLDVQAAHQQRPRGVGHGALDLEADDVAEAALAQLLLDRLEQIRRLFLFECQVRVARDAEEVVLEDLHAREERVEVGGDDLLEQHVRLLADFHQARQDRRHLDAREQTLVGDRVAHGDRE